MRVLMIGISYAPEETGIAPYTTGLAEHLARRGHRVTVLTGVPSYPQWQVHPEYRGALRRRERLGGVDVHRVRNYVPRTQSVLQRGLYEASFLLGGLVALTLPKPDAILGVVPALSGGLLARLAARRHGAPYGLIFQDLTGPAASQSGVAGGGSASASIGAAEGWAARGAAAVGVIAEGFRPYLESLGVEPDRIHRVRNWIHVQEPKLDRAAVRRRLDLPQEAVICLHAGNMGHKQGLANVVECARIAASVDPRLLFVLIGNGSQRPLLVDLAQRSRLPNLRFLPIQPADLFPDVLAAADVLLVNQRGSVTNMSLPGKLTSYFFSGRPVLAAVSAGSETAREIHASGAGVVVAPDDPRLLLEALQGLAADVERRRRLGEAGRAYARAVLTAEPALAGLEALLSAVAARRTPDREMTVSP